MLWTITEPCLNPEFPQEKREKLNARKHLSISSWSYDMEGHAKKCVERCCELANKTTQQLYKVSTPCLDHHQFKEEELQSVGELSKVCSQIVLKCLYLARIGRPADLMHGEEAAGRLVDVHDGVCAGSVLVHEPEQLDEEPLRVGLLQSRAVELFQALGGLLEAQAHATQKLLDPSLAGTGVKSLCVEPFEHPALRHSTSVTRMMCSLSRVTSAGGSMLLLPRVSARGALRFQE